MEQFLTEHYAWVRALHIIAIIAWMAGLLYLPRLFVYHAEAGDNKALTDTFQVMEHRLLRYIMNPAMGASWLFGGLLLYVSPFYFTQGWMHVKLTAIILLTVAHMMMARWRRQFAAGQNTRSATFYRMANEVPTVLMVIIVIMASVKPFQG